MEASSPTRGVARQTQSPFRCSLFSSPLNYLSLTVRGTPMNPMNLQQAVAAIVAYDGKGDSAAEDALFSLHTAVTSAALQGVVSLTTPGRLWEEHFQPAVAAAEKRLSKLIHKGAPLYNNALCLFLLSDFDGAFQFVVDAETENRRLGPGAFDLLIGKDALSRPWVVDTLITDLGPRWASDYQAITGCPLSAAELIDLFAWLAQRPTDAFMVVAAAHRVRRAALRPVPNRATRLMVVRALADSLVSMESAIRWIQQGTPVTGQLHERMKTVMNQDARLLNGFNALKSFSAGQGETAVALNDLITEAVSRFSGATTQTARAGLAAYVSYRFRNSVLHVNEESLTIQQDLDLGIRMVGWTLATCRVVAHIKRGTHTGLT